MWKKLFYSIFWVDLILFIFVIIVRVFFFFTIFLSFLISLLCLSPNTVLRCWDRWCFQTSLVNDWYCDFESWCNVWLVTWLQISISGCASQSNVLLLCIQNMYSVMHVIVAWDFLLLKNPSFPFFFWVHNKR